MHILLSDKIGRIPTTIYYWN